MRYSRKTAAALVAALPVALAQTYTDCNPLEKTCPAEVGLPASSYVADFTTGGANASWTPASGTSLTYGSDGAVFTIASAGQAPTIGTDFFILGGRVDITMRPASGTGIISSIVLESADLDEIDWEFIGGDNGHVQSNFYGKGNTTSYDRVVYHAVADTQNTWHTYSIDWTKEKIDYIIDGAIVRTLPYSSPLAVGGQNFPQTPMQLKLGNWAGGASKDEGTVTWAGGKTDFSQAPFNMYVREVKITNYNPACSYEFSDRTGSWDSITIVKTGDNCSAGGAAASPAAGSSTAAASSTVAASTSTRATATSAPTSSQSVGGLEQTRSAPATTVTGSAYSTNSASISALNSGFTTAPSVGTQVPNQPGGGINNTVTGSGTGPIPTTSVVPSTGGASLNSIMTAASVLSILAAAAML